MNAEKVRKAFRVLPHQGTGVYRLDNCSKSDFVALKSDDPACKANVCVHCLALILGDERYEE